MEDFLSDEGKQIFEILKEHCQFNDDRKAIDYLELSMLANAFAMYRECARECNQNGIKMIFEKEGGGVYEQVRPEYTVMKNEFQNIIKLAPKYGFGPKEWEKIKSLKDDEKEEDGIDAVMRKLANE